MAKPVFKVERITDGLEFGDGKISGHDAAPETLQNVDETISSSPDIIVAVDNDENGKQLTDDGCGDGRPVGLTQRGKNILKQSLNRYKVFGGAPAMAVGIRIGFGQATSTPMQEVFEQALDELDDSPLDYGAHTADHLPAGREQIDSGCGAIDGAPAVAASVGKYMEPIRGALKVFGFEGNEVDEVLTSYAAYATEFPEQTEFTGSQVMGRIRKANKVIKQLNGPHRERRIVISDIEGYTVNQSLIRSVTQDKAQIFVTDMPRLRQIAAGLRPNQPTKALISELVYTLGVAAVLTPGDMPIDVIRAAT